MTIDTKNLRVLAEAACKGPFRHNKDNDQIGDVAFADKDLSYLKIQSLFAMDSKRRNADAAYVAALLNAAPALLGALERKDALLRRLQSALVAANGLSLVTCEAQDFNAELEAITKELT